MLEDAPRLSFAKPLGQQHYRGALSAPYLPPLSVGEHLLSIRERHRSEQGIDGGRFNF